jgi:hypothetical protein
LKPRIACEIAGVGVKPSRSSMSAGHLGGGEDFEHGEERRLAQGVGVAAEEDRAADALVPCGSRRWLR